MARYDTEKVWSDFRVGLLTLATLGFLILGVTLAGGDKGLFLQKTTLVRALLGDVGGLKKGSSVTMGGMVVGRVTEITFARNPGNLIDVLMEVRADVRPRIKADSVPAVRTQGMLGDRYMDISIGSDTSEALPEGTPLIGMSATDFDRTLQQANEVLGETEKMLNAVNQKQGTVGRLFYDEKFYETLTDLARELNELIKDFKKNPKRYVKLSLF